MRSAAVLALAVLSLATAGVIALELRPVSRAPASNATASSAASPTVDAADGTGAGQGRVWLATIMARPLFSPHRRPVAPVAGPAAAPAALPRLSGIVIDGKQRRVIFAPPGGGPTVAVAEGGTFNGIRVELIEAGRVTVTGATGRQVLRPRSDPGAAQPGAPAPTPVALPLPAPFQAPDPGPFTGPPGLSSMPKAPPPPPQGTEGGLPGLPGYTGPTGLSGIPGLSAAPPR